MTKKITELTEDTAPALTSMMESVKDPSGTPLSRKNTFQRIWDLLASLTADTPVDADSISFYDAGEGATNRVTLANFIDNYLRSRSTTWTNQTLTAPTIADFTNANHDHNDTDDGGVITRGYTLLLNGNGGTPADSTTYYFGTPVTRAIGTTTATHRRTYFPLAGTVIRAQISITNAAGTVGTAETSTLSLRLNNTTDTTLSSAIVNNQNSEESTYINTTGLSIAVTNTDYCELKWVTPAWVTNPTASVICVVLYIQTTN